jgi:hypothetical protein
MVKDAIRCDLTNIMMSHITRMVYPMVVTRCAGQNIIGTDAYS